MDQGVRFSDLTRKLDRARVTEKEIDLPATVQFHASVAEIRNAGGRFSKVCAELVEFLAYSGLRISEAGSVRWKVAGLPKQVGTKNLHQQHHLR